MTSNKFNSKLRSMSDKQYSLPLLKEITIFYDVQNKTPLPDSDNGAFSYSQLNVWPCTLFTNSYSIVCFKPSSSFTGGTKSVFLIFAPTK